MLADFQLKLHVLWHNQHNDYADFMDEKKKEWETSRCRLFDEFVNVDSRVCKVVRPE